MGKNVCLLLVGSAQFTVTISLFRYYVSVPLLFESVLLLFVCSITVCPFRYYLSVTSWVRPVTICPFRYYVSVPLLFESVPLLCIRSVTVCPFRYKLSVTSWVRSLTICMFVQSLQHTQTQSKAAISRVEIWAAEAKKSAKGPPENDVIMHFAERYVRLSPLCEQPPLGAQAHSWAVSDIAG